MKHQILFCFLVFMILGCQENQESASNTSQTEAQRDSVWYCQPQDQTTEIQWVQTGLGKQKAVIIAPETKPKPLKMVVFLHGDAPFQDPVYQYTIAQRISDSSNAMGVALLRPGYADACGDQSEGDKGQMMGDNYTPEVVKSLATSIRLIQLQKKPDETIIIGHSGGAALAALLAIEFPALFEKAILIACPCDLRNWRKVMQNLTKDEQWTEPMEGLSPVEALEKMEFRKKFHLYVGDKDELTPAFLSEAFYKAAQKRNAFVEMSVIEGEDHESILRPSILSRILKDASL